MTVGELKVLISFLPDNTGIITEDGFNVEFRVSSFDTDPPMYALVVLIDVKPTPWCPAPKETKAADEFFVKVSDHVIIQQTEMTVAPPMNGLCIIISDTKAVK